MIKIPDLKFREGWKFVITQENELIEKYPYVYAIQWIFSLLILVFFWYCGYLVGIMVR